MNTELQKTVEIGERSYDIRSDYRAVLDICTALSDPDLDNTEKAYAALEIFYPDFDKMPAQDYKDAIEACYAFISSGDSDGKKKAPKLVDWEQDFKYIIAPINRIIGRDARGDDYMHWWTFLSHYYEIGPDCIFSQIVRIRDKLASHKVLEKSEKEWYRKNRELVDIKSKYSAEDMDILKQWGGVKNE